MAAEPRRQLQISLPTADAAGRLLLLLVAAAVAPAPESAIGEVLRRHPTWTALPASVLLLLLASWASPDALPSDVAERSSKRRGRYLGVLLATSAIAATLAIGGGGSTDEGAAQEAMAMVFSLVLLGAAVMLGVGALVGRAVARRSAPGASRRPRPGLLLGLLLVLVPILAATNAPGTEGLITLNDPFGLALLLALGPLVTAFANDLLAELALALTIASHLWWETSPALGAEIWWKWYETTPFVLGLLVLVSTPLVADHLRRRRAGSVALPAAVTVLLLVGGNLSVLTAARLQCEPPSTTRVGTISSICSAATSETTGPAGATALVAAVALWSLVPTGTRRRPNRPQVDTADGVAAGPPAEIERPATWSDDPPPDGDGGRRH